MTNGSTVNYRLKAVRDNDVAVETYGYDALGRRAWTASGSVTNYYAYDGAQVIADLDASGQVVRSYIHAPGIDRLLAIVVHGAVTTKYACLTDHLGTVHALADETGNIIETYEYDAWGNVLAIRDGAGNPLTESAIGNRYLFQGREYSWATGFYNFRARWYDPVTGRWLSNDPIGISGGLNQYVFCANNPVNFTDAFGLDIDNSKGYPGAVWYKPEEGKELDNVPSGKKSGRQDGFVEPSTGKMYKTTGKQTWLGYLFGDDVWVDNDGNVRGIDATSREVGQEFIDELHKQPKPDKSWDKLWEKAKEIQKCLKPEKQKGATDGKCS